MTSQFEQSRKRTETPADRNKDRESVSRIINILWDKFSFISTISETNKWSSEDKNGVDLILDLADRAANAFGFDQIKIQVKSSEFMVQAFFEKGQQIEKQYGYNWRDSKLIVLNGQADQRFIVADFVAQLINILEAIGNEAAVEDLFSFLTPEVVEIYEDEAYPAQMESIRQDALLSLRAPILAWVKQIAEE